MKMIQQ